MKKNIFRSRLFLCAPAAFCLCATLLCACSAQGNAVPAAVHEQALAQLKAQDAELQALTEQVAELKAALADAQRAAVLEDTRTEREKRLAADLYAHPELIPIEGTLGGTMRFFPDESAVRVLSTASYMPLVYAYAEDGHTAVNLLFRFENAADGALKWRCVAYDHGGGLTLLEPQAE